MANTQTQRPQLSGMSIKRIAREAASLGISVDDLVDRALLALADEVDAERSTGRRDRGAPAAINLA